MDESKPKYVIDMKGGQIGVIGDQAQVVYQYIAAMYNLQLGTSGAPITAIAKNLLQPILDRHTPFGGRDAEIQRLYDFIVSTSGYLFVTGPSGFGKTALLVNWLKLLLQNGGPVKSCYHFISRQDGFAGEEFAMTNLCQQLAAYHQLSGVLPQGSMLRALYSQLLTIPPAQGEQLVVILDGLDEALDWHPGPDLFPPTLPDGLFVVFSAKEEAGRNWLESLGLDPDKVESLEMAGLSTREIWKLLRASGEIISPWADNPLFVQRMSEISGGDPFYLHYLLVDMRRGRITSLQQLEQQPKGLKDYLNKWWLEVSQAARNQQAVKDLLGYLVVAKGPLTREDLTEISDGDALDSWIVDDTIEQVQRYVVGDEEMGYSLAGARFREYLAQEKITRRDQQPYAQRLLDYCARWKDHKSRYALTYYTAHLREVGGDDELLALVDDRQWYDARIAADPSGAGYLSDLDLAWSLATTANQSALNQGQFPPLLGKELRCALATSSLHSFLGNVPPDLLTALVANKQWHLDTALAVASRNPDPKERVDSLVALLPHLTPTLVDEVSRAFRPMEPDREKADALVALLPYLAGDEQQQVLREALEVVGNLTSLPEPYYTSDRVEKLIRYYAKLVRYMPEAERRVILQQALEDIRKIDWGPRHSAAFKVLIPELPEAERPAVLQEALDSVWPTWGTQDSSMHSAMELVDLLPAAEREAALADALNIARSLTGGDQVNAFLEMVPYLADPAKDEVVGSLLGLAQQMQNEASRSEVVRSIAPYLSESRLSAALTIAMGLTETSKQCNTLLALIPQLPEDIRLQIIEKIVSLVLASRNPRLYHYVTDLVPFLPEALRSAALQAVLYATRWILDDSAWIEALLKVAVLMPDSERASVLLKIVERAVSIHDPVLLSEAVAALAPLLTQEERQLLLRPAAKLAGEAIEQALELQQRMDDEDLPAMTALTTTFEALLWNYYLEVAIRAVAYLVPLDAFGPEMVTIMVNLAESILLPYNRAQAIISLIPYVPDSSLTKILASIRIESTIDDSDDSPAKSMLAALAPRLTGELLNEALSIARGLKQRVEQLEAMASLFPRLAEAEREQLFQDLVTMPKALALEDKDEADKSSFYAIKQGHVGLIWKSKEVNFSGLYRVGPSDSLFSNWESRVSSREARGWIALAGLAPFLAENERNDILQKAASAAQEISSIYDKVRLLTAVASQLPENERSQMASTIIQIATGIEGIPRRAMGLASSMAMLSPPNTYPILSTLLRDLASLTRRDLLSGLQVLLPNLISIGGPNTASDLADAIQRTIEWWPSSRHTAIADYDEALRLQPDAANAYYRRGTAYYAQREYQRAIADFSEVLRLQPDAANAYYNRGQIYYKQGEYQRAIADYDEVLRLQPDSTNVYPMRGYAYLHLKRIEEARADFQRAAERAPNDVNMHWMVVFASLKRERPGREMADHLERIAAIDENSPSAFVCRAVALGLRGNVKNGLRKLEQVLLKDPTSHQDDLFWKGMLSAYDDTTRPEVAIEAIEKALENGLPPVLLTPLYWLQKEKPRFFEEYAQPILERYGV